MRRALSILLALLASAQCATAAEMRSIEMQYEGGRYSMVSVAWFDAGIDETFHVFSTWEYSTRFSSAVVEARDIAAEPGGLPGYFVINRGCVLFFCKSMVRQGYIESHHNQVLRAVADPQFSDFHEFEESWEFSEADGGTSVRYSLQMVPDFWVPPAIGPYMIKRKLGRDGGQALDRIEAIAQSMAEPVEQAVD